MTNKNVHGTPLTIVWHVDDINVSHASSQVVTDFISWLGETHDSSSGVSNMQVQRGKVLNFLGITFYFT